MPQNLACLFGPVLPKCFRSNAIEAGDWSRKPKSYAKDKHDDVFADPVTPGYLHSSLARE
jgi:hypothetical protein